MIPVTTLDIQMESGTSSCSKDFILESYLDTSQKRVCKDLLIEEPHATGSFKISDLIDENQKGSSDSMN